MAEQWLSIVDYARATGISDMTIRRRIKTGKIPAQLKDGKYFILVDIDHNGEMRRDRAPHHASSPQVVKNHPSADRTMGYHHERPTPVVRRGGGGMEGSSQSFSGNRVHSSSQLTTFVSPKNIKLNHVPESLAEPLVDAGMASVEARALIEFCDRALDQAKQTVQSIDAKYTAKIESMNAQLQVRDQEIKSLNQQIEDLQLLVQILERKKVG